MLISGLATGPPAGVGDGLGPFLAARTPRFLDISRHFTAHLFRPWIPSSARGIDGGPRRSTEVVLNEQCSKHAEAGGRSLLATVGSPFQTPGGFSEQPD